MNIFQVKKKTTENRTITFLCSQSSRAFHHTWGDSPHPYHDPQVLHGLHSPLTSREPLPLFSLLIPQATHPYSLLFSQCSEHSPILWLLNLLLPLPEYSFLRNLHGSTLHSNVTFPDHPI